MNFLSNMSYPSELQEESTSSRKGVNFLDGGGWALSGPRTTGQPSEASIRPAASKPAPQLGVSGTLRREEIEAADPSSSPPGSTAWNRHTPIAGPGYNILADVPSGSMTATPIRQQGDIFDAISSVKRAGGEEGGRTRSFLLKVLLNDSSAGTSNPTAYTGGTGDEADLLNAISAASDDAHQPSFGKLPRSALLNITASNREDLFVKLQSKLSEEFDFRGNIRGLKFAPFSLAGSSQHTRTTSWTLFDRRPAFTEEEQEEMYRSKLEQIRNNNSAAKAMTSEAAVNLFGDDLERSAAMRRIQQQDVPPPPTTFLSLPLELIVLPVFEVRQLRFFVTVITGPPSEVNALLYGRQQSPSRSPSASRGSSPERRSPTLAMRGNDNDVVDRSGGNIFQKRASAYVDSMAALLRALSSVCHHDVLPFQVFFVNPSAVVSRRDDGTSIPDHAATYEPLQNVQQLEPFSYVLCNLIADPPSLEPRKPGGGEAVHHFVIPFYRIHPQHIAFAELKIRPEPDASTTSFKQPDSHRSLNSAGERHDSPNSRSHRAIKAFEARMKSRKPVEAANVTVRSNRQYGEQPSISVQQFKFRVPNRVQTPAVPVELLPLHKRHPTLEDTANGEQVELLPRREELDDEAEEASKANFGIFGSLQSPSSRKRIVKEGKAVVPPSLVGLPKVRDESPKRAPLDFYRDVQLEAQQRFTSFSAVGGALVNPTHRILSPQNPDGLNASQAVLPLTSQNSSVGTARSQFNPQGEKKALVQQAMMVMQQHEDHELFDSTTLVKLTSDVVQAFRNGYPSGVPILFPLSQSDSATLRRLADQRIKIEAASGRAMRGRKPDRRSDSIRSDPHRTGRSASGQMFGTNNQSEMGLQSPPNFAESDPTSPIAKQNDDMSPSYSRGRDPRDDAAGVESIDDDRAKEIERKRTAAMHQPLLALTKPQFVTGSGRLTIFASCGVDIFSGMGPSAAYRQERAIMDATPNAGSNDVPRPKVPYRWYIERRSHNGPPGTRHVEVALDAMLALGAARSYVVSHVPPITLGLEIDLRDRTQDASSAAYRDIPESFAEQRKQKRQAMWSTLQPGVQYVIGLIVNYREPGASGDEFPSTLHDSQTFIIPGDLY